MQNKVNVRVQLDQNIADEAEKVFESKGLSMSQAINLLMNQVISTASVPFTIKGKYDG